MEPYVDPSYGPAIHNIESSSYVRHMVAYVHMRHINHIILLIVLTKARLLTVPPKQGCSRTSGSGRFCHGPICGSQLFFSFSVAVVIEGDWVGGGLMILSSFVATCLRPLQEP